MATYIVAPERQAMDEIKQWDFDFTGSLPSGVTVSSAIATHTPPSGSASTPTVGAPVGAIVPVKLGPLSVTGQHFLECLATLSDAEKASIKLLIPVDW